MGSKVYVTLFILWIGHFLVDFMIGIWPVYKTMAALDLAKAGVISASCAFIGEGLQIYFGPLSDKGWRLTLIAGGILAAAATTLMAYTEDYFLLFLIFLMTCVGSGAFHPSAIGLLGNLAGNRKGLFITIFATGGALGLATSQIIFSETYLYFGGHTICLLLPTIIVIAFLLLYGIASGTDIHPNNLKSGNLNHPKAPRRRLTSVFKLFRHRELRILYLSQICNQTVAWGTIFLLPDILISRGYDLWVSFGGAHLLFIVGSSAMMIPGGYLSDKYSSKMVVMASSIMGIVFLYVFLFTPEMPVFWLLVVLFLAGAMMGVVSPVQIALGNRLMPRETGTVTAFLMGLALCIAEGLGQGGGGLLTKCFEEDAAAKALMGIGVFFIIGIFIAARLPSQITEEHEFVLTT